MTNSRTNMTIAKHDKFGCNVGLMVKNTYECYNVLPIYNVIMRLRVLEAATGNFGEVFQGKMTVGIAAEKLALKLQSCRCSEIYTTVFGTVKIGANGQE